MAQNLRAAPGRDRIARLQGRMDISGLDAILISNPRSFRYFTGHHPLLSISPTRPWYLVVPRRGDPVACVPSIGADDFRAESWLTELRTWPSPNPDDEGRSVVGAALADLPLAFGRIGAELGREMRAGMPIADLDQLRASNPSIEWVDAADLLWSLRMIKDETEIAAMRRAIGAAAGGFAQISTVLRAGMSEREAARILAQAVIAAGADTVGYLACCSGPGGYPSLTRAASDRALSEGDVIGFDIGAVVDGYWCDFNRNFAVGTISDVSRRAQDALRDAIRAGAALCRPGLSASELRFVMESIVEAAGFNVSPGGRWGHGVGLDFTEPPSLTHEDTTLLLPGMVVTLEPIVQLPEGMLLVDEDMLLITESGAEILTPRTLEKF